MYTMAWHGMAPNATPQYYPDHCLPHEVKAFGHDWILITALDVFGCIESCARPWDRLLKVSRGMIDRKL